MLANKSDNMVNWYGVILFRLGLLTTSNMSVSALFYAAADDDDETLKNFTFVRFDAKSLVVTIYNILLG